MLFNSYIFIFIFLPISLFLWYGTNKLGWQKLAKFFLCLMSFIFYGYFNVYYTFILFGSLVVNYGISHCFTKTKTNESLKKIILILGIAINLGLLGYFKYYDFFVLNINGIFKTDFNMKNILLPLGISFFTFQQISFVVDRYKGTAPHYKLLDYAAFITFFSQLVAGPIVLHNELAPQFEDESKKNFSYEDFSEGLCIFVVGLAWKVLIADNLGLVADYSFSNIESLDVLAAALGALTYSLELFFDFAGYSNMAIGIGKMFRIDIPENFDRPFSTTNNKDTWRRWHITLGRFFRSYVYFPLGGSRKGFARALINTMIVFSLSGLWHGADWTFVIWGIMHGALICINMIWKKCIDNMKKAPAFLKSWIVEKLCIILNFAYFCLAMIFFRSESLNDAKLYFERLFSGINYGFVRVTSMEIPFTEIYPILKVLTMKLGNNVCYVYIALYLLLLAVALFISWLEPYRQRYEMKVDKLYSNNKFQFLYSLWIGFLFCWSLVSLSGVSQFLYFNF